MSSNASDAALNRRRFLSLALGAGAVAALAACGGGSNSAPQLGGAGASASSGTAASSAAGSAAASGAASATGSAAGSGAAATGQVVAFQDKTFADIGFSAATDLYNKSQPAASQVLLETVPDGWDTKVLAQIKDKNLRWSGHGYIIFSDQYKRVKSGMVAPLDDLLKASKVPSAANQKTQYFTDRIYNALLLDGKQYYIPMKINVHMAGFRIDHLQAAGYDSLPKTWDEIDKMLPKLKKALEKDQVIPFSITNELWRAIGTTFSTFIEKPLDDLGVFKIESPEWVDLLGLFKKWIDAGLARYDVNAEAVDAWQKGKFSLSTGSHSWVRLGRQVWGAEKVKGAAPPQANASAPARTWAHLDAACVFNAAPAPQQALDYFLTVCGPEGAIAETWWKGALTFSGSPVHQAWIDKLVTPNKEIAEIDEVLKLLPNSQIVGVPQTNGFGLCQLLMPPYLDKIFKGELAIKDAMAKLRTEIDAELAKQKA